MRLPASAPLDDAPPHPREIAGLRIAARSAQGPWAACVAWDPTDEAWLYALAAFDLTPGELYRGFGARARTPRTPVAIGMHLMKPTNPPVLRSRGMALIRWGQQALTHRAARRAVLRAHRDAERDAWSALYVAHDPPLDPEAALLEREQLALLLAHLPTRCAELLDRRFDGERLEDIAIALGRSRERVRQILAHGLRAVARAIEKAHDPPPAAPPPPPPPPPPPEGKLPPSLFLAATWVWDGTLRPHVASRRADRARDAWRCATSPTDMLRFLATVKHPDLARAQLRLRVHRVGCTVAKFNRPGGREHACPHCVLTVRRAVPDPLAWTPQVPTRLTTRLLAALDAGTEGDGAWRTPSAISWTVDVLVAMRLETDDVVLARLARHLLPEVIDRLEHDLGRALWGSDDGVDDQRLQFWRAQAWSIAQGLTTRLGIETDARTGGTR